jgi:hypothetical protein
MGKSGAPILEIGMIGVAIFAPELIPAIGGELLGTSEAIAAGTATAGQVAAAQAAGAAAISGTGQALMGGSPEDVAKSAAFGGAGAYAGEGAKYLSNAGGITGAAIGGAASSGTQAALKGQDVGQAALTGGATAGLSSALQEGYKSMLPPEKVDYGLSQPSGTGLKGSAEYTNVDPTTGQVDYSLAPADKTTVDIGKTDPTQGPVDYSFTPSGNEASGIQTTDISSDKNVFSPTTLSSADKAVADYIARYAVNKLSPAKAPAASETSSVAMGSQQSPTAGGAADVAMLDSTSPEGIGSKTGKKGGKYPWGDPEGTTALKQEGQGI